MMNMELLFAQLPIFQRTLDVCRHFIPNRPKETTYYMTPYTLEMVKFGGAARVIDATIRTKEIWIETYDTQ